MSTLEFWYEFASTYSYPAAMRVDEVAKKAGLKVRWQPFLLGPIFKKLSWPTSPFNMQPAKGRYMWRDLERTCEALELPRFCRPEPFPQNSLIAARIAWSITDNQTRAEFSRKVYRAQFAEGHSIDDPDLLQRLAPEASGQHSNRALEAAQDPSIKAGLKSQVERAECLGIFGAPTFVTTDGEIFWGNDRLDEAVQWQVSL